MNSMKLKLKAEKTEVMLIGGPNVLDRFKDYTETTLGEHRNIFSQSVKSFGIWFDEHNNEEANRRN